MAQSLEELARLVPDTRKRQAIRYLRHLIELGTASKSSVKTWDEIMPALPRHKDPSVFEIHQELCREAESILCRPATLEDLTADLVRFILQRFDNRFDASRDRWAKMRARVHQLQLFAKACTKKFNHPAIDFDGLGLSRRAMMEAEVGLDEVEAVGRIKLDEQHSAFDSRFLLQPLADLIETYKTERLVGKSHNQYRLLVHACRKFSEYLVRPAVIQDLNSDTVGNYLTYLLNRPKVARRSVLCHQERLNSLWRFAARKRWLPTFPDLPLVSCPERIPEAWSRDEMQAILEAVDRAPGNLAGAMGAVPYKLYWKALIYFLYDTAERIGAALQVEYADISGEWVTIRAEARKGKTRDKRFKLRPCTLDAIAELRSLTNPREVSKVFFWPQSYTYVWTKFKAVLSTANLPDHRRNKFHKFRRTAASDFEAAGGNATKLLDHRNRATTEKYIDPRAINEVMPADIVPGIGAEVASQKPASPKIDSALLGQLKALLASAESGATNG